MHKTKIDIPENTRRALIELLQARLADSVDLQTQIKQAHWTVRGPRFIALHELFDEIHGEVTAHVDTIAERIAILGGTPEGTARVAASRSSLSEYPLTISTGPDHVEAMSAALASFGKKIRAAIDEASEIGDADVEDLFTEVSRAIDKNLWFVEAHAQADA